MFKLKIAALFDRTLPDLEPHDVYVVQDGDVVFYVGMTGKGIVHRMYQHLGWSNSRQPLGHFIYANLPQSRDWIIYLYTKEECGKKTARLAEASLIRSLHPCLNRMLSVKPTPLPDRYKQAIQIDYQVAPSDLIDIKITQR